MDENVQRDVYTMVDWAANCGVQQAEGFEVTSYDGEDYLAVTQADLPAGTPVLCVPEGMCFSSYKATEEFGGAMTDAENQLASTDKRDKMALFRVFYKILSEYQKGEESPWYPWLNSLPRLYNTGASMTFACFECLPQYAASLALAERSTFVAFQKAIDFASYLSDDIKEVKILKWAYNVAITRSIEYNGERMIAPMADMFNHGTETEVEISYDEEGNCMVYASRDVPAGSPLRMSLGDPTNPTPLFATYGFLDETSPASFCKVMHLLNEMEELGYTFADLLFYKDTGDISMQVYDVQLYAILKKNDPQAAQGLYQAVMNGDEDTKNQFHEQYWEYTKEEMQNHVDGTILALESYADRALSYDPATHPRVPVIMKHNAFVKETFLKVKENLDNM